MMFSPKIGDIVHFHHLHGTKYIRCVVVETQERGEKLAVQAVALVGKWTDSELPYRRPDGEVAYPWAAEKVIEKNIFVPGSWELWEHPRFSKTWNDNTLDPTNLEPVSLELPEMTPAEAELAVEWQMAKKCKNILDPTMDADFHTSLVRRPPYQRLEEVYALLQEFFRKKRNAFATGQKITEL